eukprot:scaffold33717_cov80-Phaeocystis_antarctica.AAC.1
MSRSSWRLLSQRCAPPPSARWAWATGCARRSTARANGYAPRHACMLRRRRWRWWLWRRWWYCGHEQGRDSL